jgi:hypothetical protein
MVEDPILEMRRAQELGLADRTAKGRARPRGQIRIEDLVGSQRRPTATCVGGDVIAVRRLNFADGSGIFGHRPRIDSPGLG